MPRLNINDLPEPLLGYRLERFAPPAGKKPFETPAKAEAEDAKRVKSMRVGAKLMRKPERAACQRLAQRIEDGEDDESGLKTMASAVDMRDFRRRFGGAMLQLLEASDDTPIRFTTIIPKRWEVPAGELHTFDPKARLKALKTALYRCGAKLADGWLILFVHGEHEPNRDVYQLHTHGFAAGGMIDAVKRLRRLPQYRAYRPGERAGEARIKRRVHFRKHLADLPQLAPYMVQSSWPKKWVGDIEGPDGVLRRVRRRVKGRIAEPQHSEVLLWLDQHRPADLCLMLHVGVTKTGFRVSCLPKARKSKTYSNSRANRVKISKRKGWMTL